jgi:hypothetical protein
MGCFSKHEFRAHAQKRPGFTGPGRTRPGPLLRPNRKTGRNTLLEGCFCNQISLTWMQYSHEWVGSIRGGRRLDGRRWWVHNGSQRPDQAQAKARRHLGPAQRERLRASAAAARDGRRGDGFWLFLSASAARRGARSRGTASGRRERVGLAGAAQLRPRKRRDTSCHQRKGSGCRAASGIRATYGRRTARAHRAGCGREGHHAVFGCATGDPRQYREGQRAIRNGRGRGPVSGRGSCGRPCGSPGRRAGRHANSQLSRPKQDGAAGAAPGLSGEISTLEIVERHLHAVQPPAPGLVPAF